MIPGGGPAFPFTLHNNGVETLQTDCGELAPGHMAECSGMLLRDYFAAKAMQGMLPMDTDNGRFRQQDVLERTAVLAYAAADAMLKVRSQ